MTTLRYLSRTDVEQVGLSMTFVIDLLEKAFCEKAAGQVEMPPKPGIHPRPDSFIHAMPAYIPALNAGGIKWVAGYPANMARGLPYITGLIILNDLETGIPLAVMDATWVTTIRTGAATALAARYLARPDSHTAGIVACGAQGRSNLIALSALFPLRQVYAYDLHADVARRYAAEMSALLNLEVVPVETPRAAVEPADLVVTSGPIQKHPQPVIPPEWLAPGVFASSVDFGSYWTPAAVRGFDRFITDDLPQWRYYQSIGYFADLPDPHTDLADMVAAGHPARTNTDERTLAINLGLAMEDMAVAAEIFRRAQQMKLGVELPL